MHPQTQSHLYPLYSSYKTIYDRDGFVVIPKFFSPDEVKMLEKELQNFIQTFAPQLTRDEINYTKTGEINSIHRLGGESCRFHTYFTDLIASKKMVDLSNALLGEDSITRKAEFFGKPAKVGMKSPWHQDNYYWCVNNHNALTFWIALDKADPENGGVTYLPGSQNLGLLEHKDSFAPGSSQMVADESIIENSRSKLICPTIEPGDVLAHHSLVIHGSEDNKSDSSRRGITLSYRGASSHYDDVMLSNYKSRLNKQVDARLQKKD